MKWSNEPVLLSAIVAGLMAATAAALTILSTGGTVLAAAALWLTQVSICIGGGKIARDRAYGPETAQVLMDTDAFLKDIECGEQ